MKIAVDSSVILDVLTGDPTFGSTSREALRRAYDAGNLVACDIVWGEVRAHFPEAATFHSVLADLGLIYEPLQALAARESIPTGQRAAGTAARHSVSLARVNAPRLKTMSRTAMS